jgi:hypothetical protein
MKTSGKNLHLNSRTRHLRFQKEVNIIFDIVCKAKHQLFDLNQPESHLQKKEGALKVFAKPLPHP